MIKNSSSTIERPEQSTPTENSTPKEAKERPLIELLRFAIIALIIVIPVRMYVAQPFIVSGASMDDTFHNGQYLIVDRITYYFEEPARGDVIVFRYPKNPSEYFIKRIIGVPGDTVTIENSVVTITNKTSPEGFTLEEPYVDSMHPEPPFQETLGDREYFVMGDNRDHSSDSRRWGVLQRERIVGRALIRLFPPSEIDLMPGAFDLSNEKAVSTYQK